MCGYVHRIDLQLREQRGLVSQGSIVGDQRAPDDGDRDRQNLGPAAGRVDSWQQPGQLPIVRETGDVFMGHSPPVTRSGYPAKGQVGRQMRQDILGQAAPQSVVADRSAARREVLQDAVARRQRKCCLGARGRVNRRVEGVPDPLEGV